MAAGFLAMIQMMWQSGGMKFFVMKSAAVILTAFCLQSLISRVAEIYLRLRKCSKIYTKVVIAKMESRTAEYIELRGSLLTGGKPVTGRFRGYRRGRLCLSIMMTLGMF